MYTIAGSTVTASPAPPPSVQQIRQEVEASQRMANAVQYVHDHANSIRPKNTLAAFTGKQKEFVQWATATFTALPNA